MPLLISRTTLQSPRQTIEESKRLGRKEKDHDDHPRLDIGCLWPHPHGTPHIR